MPRDTKTKSSISRGLLAEAVYAEDFSSVAAHPGARGDEAGIMPDSSPSIGLSN